MAYRENGHSNGLPDIHRNVGASTRYTVTELRSSGSSTPLNRPGSPNPGSRKMLLELQEQVKILKEDLRKKDSLITQISSSPGVNSGPINAWSDKHERHVTFAEPAYTSKVSDTSAFEALLSSALQPQAPNRASEIAGLQVKIDNLEGRLRECQAQADCKDIRIKELKTENESFKENEARLQSVLETMRRQIEELEHTAGSVHSVKSKSEMVISSLQMDNSESRERIIELESRVRTLLSEKEELEQCRVSFERKFHDLMSQTSSVLRIEDYSSSSMENVIAKIADTMQENAILKGKLVTLNETLANTELETKASRETIMRLVSEVGREQKASTATSTEIQNLRLERDNAMSERHELLRENDLLKERLEQTTKAWTATRNELEQREGRLNKIDREHRERNYLAKNMESSLHSFKESLAHLLGDPYTNVQPTEDAIKEKVRELIGAALERKQVIEAMEQKLRRVTEQYDALREKSDINERRARRAEADLEDIQSRLHNMESDFSSSDILKDGLRRDKDHFLKFMEKLSSIMKVDRMNSDIGFDMSGEALLARASQLIKLETEALADRSTHIYNLQRKIKAMKQQLESKDLHLDLMRKKVAGMDEKLHGRTDLEREKDGESMKVRKLAKELDRCRENLRLSRNEIVELKAEFLECSNLKLTCIEQDKEISGLEKTLEKLERVRQVQAKKIQAMRKNIDEGDRDSGEKRIIAEDTVQALSSELRTTKRLMEEATDRERELLELRQVTARMLGLDINTLAVPNYEIIARLEKLIQAYQSAGLTGFAIDHTMGDMEDGFRAGYEDAKRFLGPRGRSPKRPHHHKGSSNKQQRPRSTSPVRRDPRQY